MPTQTWFKPEQAYREGKHLTLFPYEPDRPHASGQYHFHPLPEDLPKGHIRSFDTATDFSKTQAKIQIQEIIRQGVNRKSQIFRCSVSQPPEEQRPAALLEPFPPSRDKNGRLLPGQLVAKVFDYEYYPSDFSAPWPNDEEADGNHCREHAVYAYYRRHGKTGYPHIIPQFYGSWVSKIYRGHDKNNQPMFRYVGLILIEYINGYSVENLCLRERDGEYFGPLQPSKRTVPFRSLQRHQNRRDNVTEVRFDREMRQYVIKEMVHGVVVGMHLGVEHQECEPWNLFVSMHNGLDILEKPRVVLLDHSYTQVWSLTKYAETQGHLHCLQKLPYPPHPRERCSVVALDTFQGWWPPHNYDKNKFIEWMCSKDVFGPHVEARSVLDPLLKQRSILDPLLKQKKKHEKLWEHSYNKYSTFATLDAIEAKEDEVYNAGIASKILQFVRMNEDLNRDGRGEERERAITEGVEECAATSAMTSDSYTLWNRIKVRELRERRRQAEAQALSPPPQVSTSITRIDSSHHDPSRASTIHSATPAGAENRAPQTRVYSRPMNQETLDHLSRLEEQQVERPIPAVDRPGSGGSLATRRQHRPLSMDANISPSDPVSRPTSSGSPRPQLASITKRSTSSGSPRPALAPVTNRPTSSGSPRPALAPVTNRPTSSGSPRPALAPVTNRPTSSGSPRPALAPVTNRPTSSGSPRPALAPVTNRPTSSGSPRPALAPVTNRPTSSRAPQSPLYSEIHLPRGSSPTSPSLPLRQRFASPSQMSTVSSSAQPAGQENSPKLPPIDDETSSEDELPPPWSRRR